MSKVVKTFRIAGVTVDVWKHKEKGRVWYTAMPGRDLRTDAGKYLTVSALNFGDIANARELLRKASNWIMKQ